MYLSKHTSGNNVATLLRAEERCVEKSSDFLYRQEREVEDEKGGLQRAGRRSERGGEGEGRKQQHVAPL